MIFNEAGLNTTNLFCCVRKVIVARVGKLKVGQGSFPRKFRRLFHLKLKRVQIKNTHLHIWDARKHT